jgi:hypothetical protein
MLESTSTPCPLLSTFSRLPADHHSVIANEIRGDLVDAYRYLQDRLNPSLMEKGFTKDVIDPKRCFAMGWSAGGISSLWLVSKTLSLVYLQSALLITYLAFLCRDRELTYSHCLKRQTSIPLKLSLLLTLSPISTRSSRTPRRRMIKRFETCYSDPVILTYQWLQNRSLKRGWTSRVSTPPLLLIGMK